MLFKLVFSFFFVIWVIIFMISFINFNNKIMILKPNIWFYVINFFYLTQYFREEKVFYNHFIHSHTKRIKFFGDYFLFFIFFYVLFFLFFFFFFFQSHNFIFFIFTSEIVAHLLIFIFLLQNCNKFFMTYFHVN